MMPYDLGPVGFIFVMLTALTMLVKYERRLKRWALRDPRRRKKTAPRLALR